MLSLGTYLNDAMSAHTVFSAEFEFWLNAISRWCELVYYDVGGFHSHKKVVGFLLFIIWKPRSRDLHGYRSMRRSKSWNPLYICN